MTVLFSLPLCCRDYHCCAARVTINTGCLPGSLGSRRRLGDWGWWSPPRVITITASTAARGSNKAGLNDRFVCAPRASDLRQLRGNGLVLPGYPFARISCDWSEAPANHFCSPPGPKWGGGDGLEYEQLRWA